MRKVISAAALLLVLTCSAHAGWMPNGEPEPPPPTNTAQGSSTTDEDAAGTTNFVMDIALTLLEGVLP